MGIKKLSKFLISHNIVDKYTSFDDFVSQNKNNLNSHYIKICIDASLYIHKYNHSYNDIIFGFMNQILRMLSSGIMPIYVFDGKPPVEKNNVMKSRMERKNRLNNRIKDLENTLHNIDNNLDVEMIDVNDINEEMNRLKKQVLGINRNDVDNLKKLLEIIGLPYINANGEADIICAELTKKNLVYACLSDDMDLLAFGCKKIIRLVDGNIYEYDLNKILFKLRLSYEQFVEMCIIIGCDYIRSLKINPELAYEYIKKYNNIVNFENNILNVDKHDIENVKKLFIKNDIYEVDIDNLENVFIDYDKVILFLRNNKYENCIEYLNKYRYKINLINRINKPIYINKYIKVC